MTFAEMREEFITDLVLHLNLRYKDVESLFEFLEEEGVVDYDILKEYLFDMYEDVVDGPVH